MQQTLSHTVQVHVANCTDVAVNLKLLEWMIMECISMTLYLTFYYGHLEPVILIKRAYVIIAICYLLTFQKAKTIMSSHTLISKNNVPRF